MSTNALATIETITAVEVEKHRAAAEAKAAQEAAEARERNKKHAAKINNEAREAIISLLPQTLTADFTEQLATSIVTAIAKGLIPHTKITY